MKIPLLVAALAALPLLPLAGADAVAPKKLLVVSVTTGFTHSSIGTGKKVMEKLATESGAFTLDFVDQPPGKPNPPKAPGKGVSDPAAKQKFDADTAAYKAAMAAWNAKVAEALLKLSPESLAKYDGLVFLSTTGDLPIPDKEGLLAWIKAGHAFIGIHSATDTFHGWPEYADMIGGEFQAHRAQVPVDCLNQDPNHPATKCLGADLPIQLEEIYRFKRYDPARVHELLVLDKDPNDKTPGHFPIAWCRDYGKGKVFYTALGHREDIWDADPAIKDRRNPPAVAAAFQAHLLGGIKWALGLEPGDSAPKAK